MSPAWSSLSRGPSSGGHSTGGGGPASGSLSAVEGGCGPASACSRSMGRLRCTGPGRPPDRGLQRPGHDVRQRLGPGGHVGPLGRGRRHGRLVQLLEGPHAGLRERAVTADHHQGRLGRTGHEEAGDAVAVSGPCGEQGHPGLAGETAPAVGHVHGRRLVAGVDELEAAADAGVEERQVLVAGEGEEMADPGGGQGLDDALGPGHGHRGASWSSRGRRRSPRAAEGTGAASASASVSLSISSRVMIQSLNKWGRGIRMSRRRKIGTAAVGGGKPGRSPPEVLPASSANPRPVRVGQCLRWNRPGASLHRGRQ